MTHFTQSFATALLPLSLAVTACAHPRGGAEDFLEPDELSFRSGTLMTGKRLNTNHKGDHWFDNIPLGGQEVDGVKLHHVEYIDSSSGFSMDVDIASIDVVDGQLHAQLTDGMEIIHEEFENTHWTLEIVSATEIVELTVDVSSDPSSNTPLYAFYYELGEGEERLPTCELPSEGPDVTAAVYRDLHVDEDGFMSVANDVLYIGCINGAVGKASLWGYRPDYGDFSDGHWGERLPAFEAAVRMIRADYCGDGVSHTQPGTPVYVEDDVGFNIGSGPVSEAVWGIDGALCLDQPRISGSSRTCASGAEIPLCNPDPESVFGAPGALFQTMTD